VGPAGVNPVNVREGAGTVAAVAAGRVPLNGRELAAGNTTGGTPCGRDGELCPWLANTTPGADTNPGPRAAAA
jgi:hypothetical protein